MVTWASSMAERHAARLKLVVGIAIGSGIAAFVASVAWSFAINGASLPWGARVFLAVSLGLAGIAGGVAPLASIRSHRLRALHETLVEETESTLSGRIAERPLLWNVVFAALALFVEMSIIRWIGALLPHLAHLRNFALLACFLGLGVGVLSGRRRPSLVPYLVPLLVLHYLQAVLVARFSAWAGPLDGLLPAGPAAAWVLFRSATWQLVLTVLVTVPPGQLVGRLLAQRSDLGGYGANLAGSLLGVLVAYGLSALWTAPPVWFGVIVLTYLAAFHPARSALIAVVAVATCLAMAAIAGSPADIEVWSPYQRILLKTSGLGHALGDGRLGVFANGNPYQSFSAIDTSRLQPEKDVQARMPTADLGPLAGRLAGKRVLALGTGAGANLASLLRANVASVTAVDIDPAIVYLGHRLNGDRPFADPRVKVVVDDARSYLRSSREQFDLILFLWIDSHQGVTSGAGFRLDSFIYTRECFQESAKRLAPDGQVLLYAWMSPPAARKIFRAFGDAFPERSVATFRVAPYSAQWLFAVGDLDRSGGSPAVVPMSVGTPAELGGTPVPSDDWPFVYLDTDRASIVQLLAFLLILLVVSAGAVALALSTPSDSPAGMEPPMGGALLALFFLFGAAFMLLETVTIVHVSLLFGHTWQVVGAVILALLSMAFLGNALVLSVLARAREWVWFSALIAVLLVCARVGPGEVSSALGGGNGAIVAYLILAASPVVFSSVLFSLAAREAGALDRALGANLLGSMVGGCLEYGSMAVGYRAIALAIPALYLAAWGCWWLARRAREGCEGAVLHSGARSAG